MSIANADFILNERMQSIFCYVNLYVGDCTSEVEWHQKLLKGVEMFVPAGQVWDCSWIALTRHNKHYLFLLCSESDSKNMWNKLCQCKDRCTRLSCVQGFNLEEPTLFTVQNVNHQILSLSDL